MRRVGLLLVLLVAFSVDARRRAVRAPGDETTPAGWLAAHAHVLSTTELVPDSGDLAPLRTMIGDAEVVALGEATHGTHEFYTVKLRVVDLLVREMGFDVIAFEAPFPLMNRIDAYVQGEPGDPRALLREMWPLRYFFWSTEEIVAVVEWMREYNAHRGERAPIHIAGADVTEPNGAANEVIAYLRIVDPPKAVAVEEQYACVRSATQGIDADCEPAARMVLDELATRATELTERSSAAAYEEALHNARVVVQSRWPFGPEREAALAANALWLRAHRGAARKMIVWAHNEHVAKSDSEWAGERPMGRALHETLDSDYFALCTLTAGGSFLSWSYDPRTDVATTLAASFPPIHASYYESSIRQRGAPLLLIPLRGSLPSWLSTPSRYNASGTTSGRFLTGSLPAKFDAAIYVETSTPTHVLTPSARESVPSTAFSRSRIECVPACRAIRSAGSL